MVYYEWMVNTFAAIEVSVSLVEYTDWLPRQVLAGTV